MLSMQHHRLSLRWYPARRLAAAGNVPDDSVLFVRDVMVQSIADLLRTFSRIEGDQNVPHAGAPAKCGFSRYIRTRQSEISETDLEAPEGTASDAIWQPVCNPALTAE